MSTIIMSKCWPLQGMSPAQKAVLISLADQANDDGVCWPSVKTIAERTCLSERAVQGAIKWLSDAGVLVATERTGRSTVYQITPAAFAPPQEMRPADAAPHPRRSCTPPPQEMRGTPADPAPRTVKEPTTNRKEPSESARSPRATRLAPDWTLPDDWLNWALAEQPSWQPADVLRIAEQFRDYWIAKGGADARKVDWGATWRNWVRRERQSPARTTNVRPPTARPSAYEQGMAAAERAKAMIFGDAHEAC